MRDSVEAYYGSVLATSDDLKTNACTPSAAPPPHLRPLLAAIHPEISGKSYGCGLVYPPLLENARVLDLGCGTGRDCYVLSQMVGENGYVVGVDMTDEQLEVAEKYLDYQMQAFGYRRPNVEFHKGYIERLEELGLEPGSFDVIVSNCVINLAIDKPAVLRQANTLLKPGGEMYFSDIYADRRIPHELASDPVLYGECLGGALYWNDFLRIAKHAGFLDPRLVEDSPISITDAAILSRVEPIDFYSATYRLFKLADLEPDCEDYGQAVVYRGSIAGQTERFVLDKHHVFERDRVHAVCGNTRAMLRDTRFKDHFEFIGGGSRHYGIFAECGVAVPFDSGAPAPQRSSACC